MTMRLAQLRVAEPARPRPFRVPLVSLTVPLAVASCLVLIAYLPAVWLALGLVLYFARLRVRGI